MQKAEKAVKLDVYCDGGARGNPGPAAIGFVVKESGGRVIHQSARRIGRSTNNDAEYQAVIAALKWLVSEGEKVSQRREYTLFLDSRLVVNQLNGTFKVKDARLRQRVEKVRKLEGKAGLQVKNKEHLSFSQNSTVAYRLIPRELNTDADALVNQALDAPPAW